MGRPWGPATALPRRARSAALGRSFPSVSPSLGRLRSGFAPQLRPTQFEVGPCLALKAYPSRDEEFGDQLPVCATHAGDAGVASSTKIASIWPTACLRPSSMPMAEGLRQAV